MLPVYVVCLLGGAITTALFAVLGLHGGVGHAGHVAHVSGGHGGHAVVPHAPAVHAHIAGGHAHGASAHTHGQVGANGRQTAPSNTAGAHVTSPWFHHFPGWALSWFSPLTFAAALMCFGGIGIIADEIGLGRVSLVPALAAAIAGAFLIRATMFAFIGAGTAPLRLSGEGALATVNATIRPDKTGEVIYTLEGLSRSVPARSLDGGTIERGTSVAIVKREKGVAWVAMLDSESIDGEH